MLRVLVVDDEACIREPLTACLEQLGYAIVEAKDGREACKVLVRESVDIIVCDVMMPIVNGFQLLEAIGPHIDQKVPFLYLSSMRDRAGVESAIYGGAEDYLFKPCRPAEVERVLARAAEQRQAHVRRMGPHQAGRPPVPESVLEGLAQAGQRGVRESVPPSGCPALRVERAPVLRVAAPKVPEPGTPPRPTPWWKRLLGGRRAA